jgi:hypothetical protein
MGGIAWHIGANHNGQIGIDGPAVASVGGAFWAKK